MEMKLQLPSPQLDLEFPLMKAIEQRRTKRKWIQSNLSVKMSICMRRRQITIQHF
jgi:hypothetical protein